MEVSAMTGRFLSFMRRKPSPYSQVQTCGDRFIVGSKSGGEWINLASKAYETKLAKVFEPIYELGKSGSSLDFKMLLAGEWVSLKERIEVRSPIDGGLVATVPSSSEREAGQAVEAAYTNRNAIRIIPAVEKIEIFRNAHANYYCRTHGHSFQS